MTAPTRRSAAAHLALAFVACLSVALTLAAAGSCGGRPTINVTDTFAQQEIELPLGHELVVQLSADHATGYGWQLRDSLPGVLRPLAEPRYLRDPGQTLRGRDGSVIPLTMDGSGVEIWRFEPLRVGIGRLRFEYRRPLAQEMQVERAVTWVVRVTDPGAPKP